MSKMIKHLVEAKREFVGAYLPVLCRHPNGGYLSNYGYPRDVCCFYCNKIMAHYTAPNTEQEEK